MRRAALIYNPTSGRQRHAQTLDAIMANLRRGGFDIEPAPTAYPGQAEELARARAETGDFEAVIAYGGDGTAREVAAGLLGTPVALGVLPGGTANLLALALGLPRDPVAAAAVLGETPARPIDVGIAGETPFLMMASAGLDASVLATLDTRLKWRFGKPWIVTHGLLQWWSYRYWPLELIVDGEPLEASFAAVSNIPFYGGPFRLAPQAQPDSGFLELIAFRGTGRLATLSFTLDLLRWSAHAKRKDVIVRRVKEVSIGGPEGVAAQIDGDLCQETLPMRVRLAEDRLSVLAPKAPGL